MHRGTDMYFQHKKMTRDKYNVLLMQFVEFQIYAQIINLTDMV